MSEPDLSPSDEQVEDPMPVFTIKAKDNLALDTIRHYRMLCREQGLVGQTAEVRKAEDEVRAWRSRNRALWKDPDHEHVPVATVQSQDGEREPTPAELEAAGEAMFFQRDLRAALIAARKASQV